MKEKRTVGPVTATSTVGGAIALLIGFALHTITGIELPEAVTAALAVVITAIGALTGGWVVKPEASRAKHVAEQE